MPTTDYRAELTARIAKGVEWLNSRGYGHNLVRIEIDELDMYSVTHDVSTLVTRDRDYFGAMQVFCGIASSYAERTEFAMAHGFELPEEWLDDSEFNADDGWQMMQELWVEAIIMAQMRAEVAKRA